MHWRELDPMWWIFIGVILFLIGESMLTR